MCLSFLLKQFRQIVPKYKNFMCKGLVWLREQILHGGGPAWLEPEAAAAGQEDLPQQDQAQQEQAPDEGTVKSVFKEYLDFNAN